MKKFLLRIALFLILLAICDAIVGYVGGYLSANAKTGDMRNANCKANDCDADILLMGSSRCAYHYDPNVFCEKKSAS